MKDSPRFPNPRAQPCWCTVCVLLSQQKARCKGTICGVKGPCFLHGNSSPDVGMDGPGCVHWLCPRGDVLASQLVATPFPCEEQDAFMVMARRGWN